MPLKVGLIQVYTGGGKGKTTAALGQAVRAAGQGLRTCIIQFMKGWPHYGELSALAATPAITIRQFGRAEFVNRASPDPRDVQEAERGLTFAREAMLSGQYDIIVLDEINMALDFELIPLADVLRLCDEKPEHVELILTGRCAPAEIINRADLVTEMHSLKHPYDRGLQGRRGIEY